jgi:DNA mismatch repair protein MutS2
MSAIGARTLADLGWSVITAQLARRCSTGRGSDVAAALEPELELGSASQQIAAIGELVALAEDDLRLHFGGITDIESAILRAAKGGVLSDEELVAVAGSARGYGRLYKTIGTHGDRVPVLAELAVDLSDMRTVYQPIVESYRDDGKLADHASDTLGGLRREVMRLRDRLRSRMDSIVGDVQEYLQDSYFTERGERFVVPVKVASRSRVAGIVHGTSQSGQTVFVEPAEIVDIGNQVKLAECAVADEEERIRSVLTRAVAEHADELVAAGDAATYLDLVNAGARLAIDTESSAPELGATDLALKAARHPHLVLAGKPCVANDIEVASGQVLVVSGPNAGGKTVALKTAGLAALMARAGLFILAAPGSTVPHFETVLTDVGDAQSLEHDLSTFTGHLTNLQSFLAQSTAATLLLIDEIAVGTEPEQGAALAQAVLEALAEGGTTAIVTTHYERLKELASGDPRFANASVGYDMQGMRPTFELHMGVPGSSGALIVARVLGLDSRVVERAEALLGDQRARVEELLMEVTTERDRLVEERERLEQATREAERERARAELARQEAKDAKRRAHEREHGDAVAALREARMELDKARQRAKKRNADMRAVERSIDAAAAKTRAHAPSKSAEPGDRLSAQDIEVGTRVHVPKLGQDGEVVTAPERGQVMVMVGVLKTTVAIDELERAHGQVNKSNRKARRSAATRARDQASEGRSQNATLDLRGARVDEALDAVDRFIDDSLLAELPEIYIVHGHGTGALRKAVRSHVRAHKCVSSFRAGERNEGGDGVTVAVLDV